MRNGEITPINGSWSEEEHAWVSELWCLTGDCWLEVKLPDKGRVLVRKAESNDGAFPKAFCSEWAGPEFRLRFYGSTKYRYVRIYLTTTPDMIQFANTNGYAVE